MPLARPEYAFDGPPSGADRAVLLAHGITTNRDAPLLVGVSQALASIGIPSLRFDFPYRSAGRDVLDRPGVLEDAARQAALELSAITQLAPGRLVLGGLGEGARTITEIVGSERLPVAALGLLLLGYPLHPAGMPELGRADHFGRIATPTLFVSGARDATAAPADLQHAAQLLRGPVAFHWLDATDHDFRPLVATGRTPAHAIAEAANVSATWVQQSLLGVVRKRKGFLRR